MKHRDELWAFLRGVILFFGGFAGIAHQTFIVETPNPTLLLIFGAMMGLPAFLGKDKNGR